MFLHLFFASGEKDTLAGTAYKLVTGHSDKISKSENFYPWN